MIRAHERRGSRLMKVRGTILTQLFHGQPRSVFVEYPRIDNKRTVCEVIKSAEGKFTPIGQVHQFTNINGEDEVNVAAVFLKVKYDR